MRSTVRQLITGVAVAVALSAVGVGAIGGAVAQALQRAPAWAQDDLVSGYSAAPFDATDKNAATSADDTRGCTKNGKKSSRGDISMCR